MNYYQRTPILKGLNLMALLLIGLLFMHCSTQDIDTLPPYEAENDFDEVDDLPDLDDPDPDGVDVEIGDINNSPIIDSILEAMATAGSEEELAELLGKLFERMGNVDELPENLDPEVQAFLQALDVETATRILKGELEVSPKLKELAATVGEGNSFAALLPQINLPKINGKTLRTMSEINMKPGTDYGEKRKADVGPLNSENLRTSQWGAPCEEAAQNAFDIRVGELELQKEDQLNVLDINYQSRLSEIEVNYELRLNQQQQTYDFQIDYLILNVSSVLQAISVIQNPQLKNNLLLFAAVYIIQAAQLVQNWNDLSIAAIEEAYERELEIIEDHRDARIENVEAAYDKALKFAEEILEKALARCHNQGAGN